MGNVLLFVAFSIVTYIGQPVYNAAVEVFATQAVMQDDGLGSPTPETSNGRPVRVEAFSTPILPVLASAVAVSQPEAPAIAVPAAAPPQPVPQLQADQPLVGRPLVSPTLLALARDTPVRRPDGTVFLPIATQSLIGMRTEITRVEPLSGSVQIPGRVITSRDVSTLIQSNQTGTIEAADTYVPRIGTRVVRGQLLAYQRPNFDTSKVAEVTAKIADLEGLVDMGEQRIARLGEVMFIRYRQSKIEAVRAEIASYRRQLQIFRDMLSKRTEIRARTSGVISKVNFVVGQIVEAQSTLFEIVDPTRLWVEAAAFDPALAQDIETAQAITGDGRVLPLRFSGGGLTLQNQALPLQFEVLGSATEIQIGKPVTVIVRRRQDQTKGIRLPAGSIVHTASGETVVWQRLSAETFMSWPVQVLPLDSENVMITSGLTTNMRIVTVNGAMLAQVR